MSTNEAAGHFREFQAKEAVIADVEGVIVVYSLKARKVIFRKAIDHLIMEYGYPDSLQDMSYESAYMNGSFYMHNHRGILIDYARGGKQPEFYHGLLNIKESLYKAELIPGRAIDIQRECQPLRSCLEASLVAAVFERMHRWTPRDARNIHNTCLSPTAGANIRTKLLADCRAALNYVIYQCPELRRAIISNPSQYLVKREWGLRFLENSRLLRKKRVIKSEYGMEYTNALLSYAFGDPQWYLQFDVVTVRCGPYWMDVDYHEDFTKLDEETGDAVDWRVRNLYKGAIYSGGSAEQLIRILGIARTDFAFTTADAVAAGIALLKRNWYVSVLPIPKEMCPPWQSRVAARLPVDMAERELRKDSAKNLSSVSKASQRKGRMSFSSVFGKISEEEAEMVGTSRHVSKARREDARRETERVSPSVSKASQRKGCVPSSTVLNTISEDGTETVVMKVEKMRAPTDKVEAEVVVSNTTKVSPVAKVKKTKRRAGTSTKQKSEDRLRVQSDADKLDDDEEPVGKRSWWPRFAVTRSISLSFFEVINILVAFVVGFNIVYRLYIDYENRPE